MYKKILLLYFCLLLASAEIKVLNIAKPVIHGEGPHWDPENQTLYYVDISSQTVNKYDPETNTVNQVHIDGGPVSFVIRDKYYKTKLVIGRGLDVAVLTWDGVSAKPGKIEVLQSIEKDKPGNRFNDAKADSRGRLWAGTMGPEKPDLKLNRGSLYSFDWFYNFDPIKQVSPVSISNGIAWTDDDKVMYYIDSPTRKIYAYDFDIENGTMSNQREFFNLKDNNIPGVPDGMSIDKNGDLWVAVYDGSCVLHINGKTGKLVKKIDFPCKKITSTAFGGKNLDELYVTTSRVGLSEEELEKKPLSGALFKVTGLGVRGQNKSNKVRLF